jgi:hypothetical protein
MSVSDPLQEFELVMLAEHHESEHEFCRIIHDHLTRKGARSGRTPMEVSAHAALLDEYVQLMAHHFSLAQRYRWYIRTDKRNGLLDRRSS